MTRMYGCPPIGSLIAFRRGYMGTQRNARHELTLIKEHINHKAIPTLIPSCVCYATRNKGDIIKA